VLLLLISGVEIKVPSVTLVNGISFKSVRVTLIAPVVSVNAIEVTTFLLSVWVKLPFGILTV
jgi:hypothetical protein